MNWIDRLLPAQQEFETQFAAEIEKTAVFLQDLPPERDTDGLDLVWRKATTIRRKYALFLKESLRELNAQEDLSPLLRRQVRATKRVLNSAQMRLRRWGQFDAIVSEQIISEPRELITETLIPWREVEVMDHIESLFLDSMHRLANPTAHTQDDDANDLGCHRDIPLPMGQFSKLIAAAYRVCLAQRKSHRLRFLDVGAGGGTKVLAATTCFDECVGLEYEASTVETGTRFLEGLSPDTCSLLHGNALTYDGYGDFDVIYFYRPLAQFDLMVEMEERILDQVKPGTVLLVVGGFFRPDDETLPAQKLAHQIYVAGLSPEEAEELGQLAQQMGTMVPGFGRRPPKNMGYWASLAQASRLNGYHV